MTTHGSLASHGYDGHQRSARTRAQGVGITDAVRAARLCRAITRQRWAARLCRAITRQ